MSDNVAWASTWKCWDCGKEIPIKPGENTRPISEAHECDSADIRVRQAELAAWEGGYRFALENYHDELVQADLHEFGTGWAGHVRRGPIVIDAEDASAGPAEPSCHHQWLARPESDSRECLICGAEVFGA